jgi:DNA-binding transcriptional LysR family regulator
METGLDRLAEIQLFVRVAESGSLSRATEALGLSNAAASHYLDIIDNNIDVAIRTREFEPDSNITVRRLASTRRILAASPRSTAWAS